MLQPISDNGTRKLYNVGIKILGSYNNLINTEGRNWSKCLCRERMSWYISNRSVSELKVLPKLKYGGDDIVKNK
jgi:hypothetical protein